MCGRPWVSVLPCTDFSFVGKDCAVKDFVLRSGNVVLLKLGRRLSKQSSGKLENKE